jgi:AcrR family transcriptional regulator
MSDQALTREQILDAAEDALRRFGPAKANVVDVARALGVSHGSVYRHFPSKAALRDTVTGRWLARVSDPLAEIANASGPAEKRLRRWFEALIATKRRKTLAEPELFATYQAIFRDAHAVVMHHVETLVAQLATIIADGAKQGAFHTGDPLATARAIFDATARFHNPAHAMEWADTAATDAAFERVWQLITAALSDKPRAAARPKARRGAAGVRKPAGEPVLAEKRAARGRANRSSRS